MNLVKSITQKELVVELFQLDDSYKVILSKNDKRLAVETFPNYESASVAFDNYLPMFMERNLN